MELIHHIRRPASIASVLSMRGVAHTGTATSYQSPTITPVNFRGVIPTISTGYPFSVIFFPTAAGSPPKFRCQKA